MLQAFDTSVAEPPLTRPRWMALLARAPIDMLEQALGAHAQCAPIWLRRPETGLMMVQGRTGGTGQRFNLGEVTVTRCALRLPNANSEPMADNGVVGVAYVMGRISKQAKLAAIADALLQDPAQTHWVQDQLIEPLRMHIGQLEAQRCADVAATKVEFFTVAREAGSGAEGDEA
jgi:alpha-D-ribose 1-methylphosphonate 5-triphosphate synthase subunit PhnG